MRNMLLAIILAVLLALAGLAVGIGLYAQAQPDILRARGEYELMSAAASTIRLNNGVVVLLAVLGGVGVPTLLTLGVIYLLQQRSVTQLPTAWTVLPPTQQPALPAQSNPFYLPKSHKGLLDAPWRQKDTLPCLGRQVGK